MPGCTECSAERLAVEPPSRPLQAAAAGGAVAGPGRFWPGGPGLGRGAGLAGPKQGLGLKHQGARGAAVAPHLMPSCTACNAKANFVLVATGSKGRCRCADGFGAVAAGSASVTLGGSATVAVPLFKCQACVGNTVPLGPNSGVAVLDTGAVVLRAAAVAHPSAVGFGFGPRGPGGSAGAMMGPRARAAANADAANNDGALLPPRGPRELPGGLVHGQCVECPAGSQANANHVMCVPK